MPPSMAKRTAMVAPMIELAKLTAMCKASASLWHLRRSYVWPAERTRTRLRKLSRRSSWERAGLYEWYWMSCPCSTSEKGHNFSGRKRQKIERSQSISVTEAKTRSRRYDRTFTNPWLQIRQMITSMYTHCSHVAKLWILQLDRCSQSPLPLRTSWRCSST